MNTIAGLLGEAEMHGLVDGHLEADRRADVLRRLAASAADRALVEAWQEQNDMIRAAFRDVESEALPVVLDLAPPRLRCVEGDLDRPLAPLRAPMREPPAAHRRNAFAGAAALLVVAVGMTGAWLISQGRYDEMQRVNLTPPADLESMVADRATSALNAAGRTAAPGRSRAHVPDFAADGLRLTDVSTQLGELGSLVLHYRDAGGGRVVLGLASAPDTAPTPPASVRGTIAWRRNGTAYALAGTLPAERLRKLARSLRDETGQD